MKCMKILIFLGALLTSISAHSKTLPTPEEVQGIINVCGAGRSVEAVGELGLSYKKFFSGEVGGEGELKDLVGIITVIKDQELQAEVYQLYLSCVMPLLLEERVNKVEEKIDSMNSLDFILEGNVIEKLGVKVKLNKCTDKGEYKGKIKCHLTLMSKEEKSLKIFNNRSDYSPSYYTIEQDSKTADRVKIKGDWSNVSHHEYILKPQVPLKIVYLFPFIKSEINAFFFHLDIDHKIADYRLSLPEK